MRSILRSLKAAGKNDVTVVNLRSGETWWESRLFILVAGAARRMQPRAIVFTGERNARDGVFLGWARPRDLLEAHMALNPEFRDAERSATRRELEWRLGRVDPGNPSAVILPWRQVIDPAGKPAPPSIERNYLPHLVGEATDPQFAYEVFLQDEMETNKSEAERERFQRRITLTRLEELYRRVLVIDHINTTANESAWIKLLTSNSRAFFALTDDDRLRTLVPRDALVSALLANLAARLEQLSE
jgi:hypothetical protein